MTGVHLTGLEGTNPLGFLAALGVQVAFADEPEQPRLWWSDDVTPHAIVDGTFTAERIADRALAVFARLVNGPSMKPEIPQVAELDLSETVRRKYRSQKIDELKLMPPDMRTYLENANTNAIEGNLSASLVAEGSLVVWSENSKPVRDRHGGKVMVTKPSDLCFTAGLQKFLDTARDLLDSIEREDLLSALDGPWKEKDKVKSLMWNVSERVYALMANNPSDSSSPDKKLTNPGPEALALLGLSMHPVFGGHERALTTGCSGSWLKGRYSWPIWLKPASPQSVRSLVVHASIDIDEPATSDRLIWLRAWGVERIFRSPIHRHPSGGRGNFRPPEVAWQAT